MKVSAAAEPGDPWPDVWAASTAQRLSVSASFCCIFTYSCLSRARCFCSLATSSVPQQGDRNRPRTKQDTKETFSELSGIPFEPLTATFGVVAGDLNLSKQQANVAAFTSLLARSLILLLWRQYHHHPIFTGLEMFCNFTTKKKTGYY